MLTKAPASSLSINALDSAARLAALIDPRRALPNPTPLAEAVHKDTVYITVVERS